MQCESRISFLARTDTPVTPAVAPVVSAQSPRDSGGLPETRAGPTAMPGVSVTSLSEDRLSSLRLPTPQSGNYDQFCSEKWTKRGVLDTGMFDHCLESQAPGLTRRSPISPAKTRHCHGCRRSLRAPFENGQSAACAIKKWWLTKCLNRSMLIWTSFTRRTTPDFEKTLLAVCTDKWQTDELPWGMIFYCYKQMTGTT